MNKYLALFILCLFLISQSRNVRRHVKPECLYLKGDPLTCVEYDSIYMNLQNRTVYCYTGSKLVKTYGMDDITVPPDAFARSR